MSVSYPSDSRPHIQMRHIDGPVLWMRDGRLHWLTIWERIAVRFGWHDAYSLERKHRGRRQMSIPLPPLPGWAYHTVHELRARDQEIVRCVLQALANEFEDWDGTKLIVSKIRNMEFHHE